MSNTAALVSVGLGLGLCALYAWVAFSPSALKVLRAYPRTVWPGRILAAICLIWFARNLGQVDLGGFNSLKKLLFVAVPLGIYLITVYIPDLLPVRGLCVLFLLAAQPILTAVRWSGTPASIAVGIFVYALLVKSMILVVYPHLWIRGMDWWEDHPQARRPGLRAGMFLGLALAISGAVSL